VITVAGLTPSLDLTYLVDSLQLGQIHRVPDIVRCAGGKALNMARAAVTVGGDVQVVAILGGTTGATLKRLLQAEDIAVLVVDSPAETRTCVSIAAADTNQLTEIYQEAAALPDDVWHQFHTTVASVLETSPGWLSISGRAPLGSAQMIADLVRTGRRHQVLVAVDTHSEALPLALAEGPALVKINRSEAADLLDVTPASSLVDMAHAIRARTGSIVVLTDGVAGAVAVDEQTALHVQAPDLFGLYPVGSGDSFLGGLLTVLDRGENLEQAMRAATACGVANALVPGQGHFTPAEVDRIAPLVRLRPG
jgi:1-phosphofructokinase family hexose kinase